MTGVETYTDEVTVPDLFEAPKYSLFDNVTWINGDAAGHWQAGIQYDVDCPAAEVTISGCFPGKPESLAAKAATWESITRGARAFTIYDEWDCSPAGSGQNATDLEAGFTRALKALSASAPTKLEDVFWTGSVNNPSAKTYPNLTTIGAGVTDASGRIVLQPSGVAVTGAVDIVEGLATLESMAADCYPGTVFIHVPMKLLPALAARNLCYQLNGKLYTYAGNRVIVGRGYDPTFGINGATNTTTTQMYATSPVFGIKGTPRRFNLTESFDRGVNTLKYIAEQTFLLGWHCCLAAVTVTLGGLVSGSASSAT